MTIFIDDGGLFEGNFDQFEDCFFSFGDEDRKTDEGKLKAVMWWCEREGYKLEIRADECAPPDSNGQPAV